MPGKGTRLTHNPELGDSYSAEERGSQFQHPFRASLAGLAVRLRDGRVMGIQPRIGDKLMTEVALQLDPAVAKDGESWVCVEVTPTIVGGQGFVSSGKKDEPANQGIEVVHRDSPFTQTAVTGRHPLALIVWRGNRPATLVQHTFFNLKYRRVDAGTRIEHQFT